MKNIVLLIALIYAAVNLTGCGKHDGSSPDLPYTPDIPSGNAGPDGLVVMGRSYIHVTTEDTSSVARVIQSAFIPTAYAANPATQPVTVVMAGNTVMSLSNAAFSVPSITNDILDFGSLAITSLITNDLKKCGTNGNQKCTKALFRIYTTGTAGTGFYNSVDGYGVPLIATGPAGSGEVGNSAAGAQMVQQFSIPSSRNTVLLSDFSPTPSFDIKGNFVNAGAGSYSTTIVVEFALAP